MRNKFIFNFLAFMYNGVTAWVFIVVFSFFFSVYYIDNASGNVEARIAHQEEAKANFKKVVPLDNCKMISYNNHKYEVECYDTVSNDPTH